MDRFVKSVAIVATTLHPSNLRAKSPKEAKLPWGFFFTGEYSLTGLFLLFWRYALVRETFKGLRSEHKRKQSFFSSLAPVVKWI